ncbi:hypothetical protein [Marinobacter arenosus]|uniref:hypothetical protein n=1 Tax=Marinobacter arenosus TaxID=2856822 RepID=UPI001C4CEB95|nr:hypothetical protein [Marinobacter arenosus]MBW0146262.1 hypothetical protein [Marinobacter arenosus]
MVDGLVFVIQIGLVALLLLMAYRMVTLVRAAPVPESLPVHRPAPVPDYSKRVKATSTAYDRTELFTQLHILAGLQERDCRVNGLDLVQAPAEVRDYAAVWLYGAACALCDTSARHTESVAGLAAQIANRKMGIRQPQALQAIATMSRSGVLLACYRGGLEGAEFWRHHQYVAPTNSLYQAITDNAFI